MTFQEAEEWIRKHNGRVQTKNGIEGAKDVGEALALAGVQWSVLTVGDHEVRVATAPSAPRDLLWPYLVECYRRAFGDPQ